MFWSTKHRLFPGQVKLEHVTEFKENILIRILVVGSEDE